MEKHGWQNFKGGENQETVENSNNGSLIVQYRLYRLLKYIAKKFDIRNVYDKT